MKKMIHQLKLRFFANGILWILFAGFAISANAQTPLPIGDPSPFFCSAASWAAGGLAVISGDELGDLDINGQNLQWYDSDPTPPNTPTPIASTTLMVDGMVYYVTQTIGGVESLPLVVTVTDRECGCIKEPDFEEQDDTVATPGYQYFSEDYQIAHKTCGVVITSATPSITLGTINSFNDRVVIVTSGLNQDPDPDVPNNLPRTDPATPTSTKAIRLNNDGNGQVVSMTKEFVAGEVLSFSFSLFLENPSSHRYDEQPFFQVRIYDKNNNLIQSRCIVSTTNDCIFQAGGSGGGTNLYSEWSCLKMSTSSIQGEKARVEFTVADCTRGGHAGYAYIDNIFVGNDTESPCTNISFGYVVVNSIDSDQGTGNCFVTKATTTPGACANGLLESLPFPIEVCGEYTAPISSGNAASLDDLVINIVQNGVVVGTVSSPTLNTGTQSFCFTIDETDINVIPPYGDFDFEATIDYNLDCGIPYEILIDDRSSVKICPSAGCPVPLIVCDQTGTGIGTFDLTAAEATIRNGFAVADVDVTFYESKADAFAQTGAIATPAGYNNTVPTNQTIYARLDWHLQSSPVADGCTYLVELELQVLDSPIFALQDRFVACDQNFSIPIVATPDNISSLNSVTYAWFKDGVRIPFFGSLYNATAPGTYEVTVSNDVACEKTETIVIDQVLFSVDLGPDVQECDVLDYTLTANITDEGSTPPLNPALATYLWSTGETTESITVSTSGTYSVDVTIDGCTHSASVDVEISDRPEISLGADFEICASEETQITATVANLQGATLEYKWYRDGGLIAGQNTSILPITDAGTYRVEVNAAGAGYCVGEDTIEITLYANENCVITQGISPNGDNFNQSLDLLFLDDRTGVASVEIFNRYGRSVYEKTGGYTNQWFGQTTEGDELVTGTYFYVIKLDAVDKIFDKQVLTGWIYIQRQVN